LRRGLPDFVVLGLFLLPLGRPGPRLTADGAGAEVGTPPTSALIVKELKVEKGSGDPGKTRVGNLSLAQAIKVANMKADAMLAKSLKARVLEVVGTCVSVGVTVEGKPAKEFTKEIKAGKFDKQLAG